MASISDRPRVVLADDHEGVLQELRDLLVPDFDVVCAVRNGIALLEAVEKHLPDAVISDINMPVLTGLDAATEIRQRGLCETILLLTVCADPQVVGLALNAGVRGYVVKVDAGEELIPAINSALGGATYLSRAVSRLTRVGGAVQ